MSDSVSWESILDEVGADGGNTDAPSASPQSTTTGTVRLIVVGSCEAGKRTFSQRLREALSSTGGASERATTHRTSGQKARSGGIDYAFLDLRSKVDSAVVATLEIVCVDMPSLLPVVMPDRDTIRRSAVIFLTSVVEVANRVCAETLASWREAINKRVKEFDMDPIARLEATDALWKKGESTFAKFAPPAFDATVDESSKLQLRTQSTVCLLPSVLVLNKMDLAATNIDGFSIPDAANFGTTKLSVSSFVHQFMRRFALAFGAALALSASVRTRTEDDVFYRAVGQYCVEQLLGVSGDAFMAPTKKLVEDRIAFDFQPSRFLPAGVDTPAALAKVIRIDAVKSDSVFVSRESRRPTVQTHEEVIGELVDNAVEWDDLQ